MKSCGKSRNHLNHILLDHECQYRILQQSIKLLLGNSECTKVVDWLIEQEIDHMASITKKHQMTKSYQVYICLIYKSKYLTALNIKHCQLEVSIPVRCRPISWDKLHLFHQIFCFTYNKQETPRFHYASLHTTNMTTCKTTSVSVSQQDRLYIPWKWSFHSHN